MNLPVPSMLMSTSLNNDMEPDDSVIFMQSYDHGLVDPAHAVLSLNESSDSEDSAEDNNHLGVPVGVPYQVEVGNKRMRDDDQGMMMHGKGHPKRRAIRSAVKERLKWTPNMVSFEFRVLFTIVGSPSERRC